MKAKTKQPKLTREMCIRLGIPHMGKGESSWGKLAGLSPIQCYVGSRCRWHFYGMCYCPMPEKYGKEMAYPVYMLYRACLGKYRDYVGVLE